MSAIETLGLDFRYGRETTLRDLRLRVEEGDIYGFLGPNGAGKTTTIRLLLGLVKPRRGTIRIFGSDLHTCRLEVLARVGAHVEGNAFYPYLTGRENLRLFARYHGRPDLRHIDRLLEVVGLKAAARLRVRAYSLGMKQRLGIAQALLTRPRLLILDEPLNGLDPPGVIEVRELLLRLHAEEGLTVFLSSHRLDEAERLCNRIGLIRDGTMVQEGTLEGLLSRGTARIFRVRTSDNAAATRLLGAAGWVQRIAHEDSAVEVHTEPENAGRITRALIEAGLEVEEMSPWRPSLEDLFQRAMGPAAAPGSAESAP